MRLFLVGGVVRDMLLGRPVKDLDFVVEGDAAGFARRIAAKLEGRVREHGRFQTAGVEIGDGIRIDVAAARRETYDSPGSLPRVAPASLPDDLARRDFTINAMALELSPAARPRLYDPLGGRRDLSRRRLAFLHPLSATDDPTRAFRAVRYANRLGFRIAPETAAAVAGALRAGAFDSVSGDRLRRVLELLFAELRPAAAVKRLGALGLVPALGARLPVSADSLRRLRRAERISQDWPSAGGWLLFLLVWASDRPVADLLGLAARLSLQGESGRAVRAWATTRRRLGQLRTQRRPSAIRRLLEGLSAPERGALAALLPRPAATRVLEVARRPVRLRIGGRDLVAAGVPAGPGLGRALAATLAAREDGMISADEELDFALRRSRGRGRKT